MNPGLEPQAGMDCVRSSPPVSQTTASSPGPPLTFEQRQELKQRIDAEKRRRLARAENQVRDRKRRRQSWRSYYWRNREQILERKKAQRAA